MCVRNNLGWKVVFGVSVTYIFVYVFVFMCAEERILWFLFLVIRSQVSENKKKKQK